MKRPAPLLALVCGLLAAHAAWPSGVLAEESIHVLRQPAAHEGSDFDVAMLQPGEAEEAAGDEDAETDDEAIDAEGYGPAPASGPYPKPKPKNPCAESHKNLFFLNDFSYLKDPAYHGDCLGDQLKLMPLGVYNDWGTLDVGGQYRLQYKHEVGMGNAVSGPGALRFEDTEFDLFLNRMRLYGNWRMTDQTRVYLEGIYADTTTDNGQYRPRIIDDNFGDVLNGFFEHSIADGTWTARVGRQEMLFGAQRLISPLDWANTRRTFEGAMLLYEDGPWSIDSFYTAYVPPRANEFDAADWQQQVYGAYAVYTAAPNNTLDLYYIGYDNRRPGEIVSDFSLHTFGSRLFRTFENDWMFETEGGVQLGRQSGLGKDQRAGFATVGVGRKAPDHEWRPELWTYFDYASGNDGGDDFTRFNQLFPLGHRYFGFIDAVARSNIQSPNVLLTAKPPQTNWELLCWYWYFRADQAGDIVPALSATELQSLDSRFLGQELDLIAKYVIGPRSNILFGYSHLWRGDKILAPQDADFAYSQLEVNF
jgi:hypothetical protein